MEPSMRDIVSDILTWPWFSEPHGYNFNGHLVRDPGGNICIDPVEPTDDDMDALTEYMGTKSVSHVLHALDREQADIIRQCEREILLSIRDLGGSRGAYKRERKKALNRIVSEVYSPPRVAAAAELLPSLRIIPGASLDITVDQETGEP